MRLVYKTKEHAGFVPTEDNPALKLDLGLPKPNLLTGIHFVAKE
jgi:hypothetical protein